MNALRYLALDRFIYVRDRHLAQCRELVEVAESLLRKLPVDAAWDDVRADIGKLIDAARPRA